MLTSLRTCLKNPNITKFRRYNSYHSFDDKINCGYKRIFTGKYDPEKMRKSMGLVIPYDSNENEIKFVLSHEDSISLTEQMKRDHDGFERTSNTHYGANK